VDAGQPRRILTLFDSISLTVGVIFGAGVLVTAPEVARGVGSAWGVIAIWVVGSLLSLCGAVGYAELATAYPEQGGDYVYLTRAYGRWAGFLFGWIQTLVVRPGDIAVMAYVFAAFAEPIVGSTPGGKPALAAAAVALLTAVNMAGVRLGARTQNSLTVAKLAGVLLVIAAAVFAGGVPGGVAHQTVAVDPLPLSVALILVLFSFGGWNELVFVAAEVRDPKKNIVRAMTLGMAVVTAIYLAVNTAFLRVLGFTGLAQSDSVAVDTLAPIVPARASVFVAVLTCVCALGAVNGLIFAGARIAYAVGRDHCLFGALGRWSVRTGTPVPSLALQGALSVALILALGSFIDTVMYTAAAVYLFYLVTSAAVIVLRYRDPAAPRPYRATGFPVTTLTFCLVCGFLIVAAVGYRPTMAVASMMVILLGVPAFRLSELASRRRSIRTDSSPASGKRTRTYSSAAVHPAVAGRRRAAGNHARIPKNP
jgi:amino acid transporter